MFTLRGTWMRGGTSKCWLFNAVDVDPLIEDAGSLDAILPAAFGAEVEHRGTMEDQGVKAASLRVGGGRVELLEPLGSDTPVGRFLAKRGPGMHHVAYEVDDLREPGVQRLYGGSHGGRIRGRALAQ